MDLKDLSRRVERVHTMKARGIVSFTEESLQQSKTQRPEESGTFERSRNPGMDESLQEFGADPYTEEVLRITADLIEIQTTPQ